MASKQMTTMRESDFFATFNWNLMEIFESVSQDIIETNILIKADKNMKARWMNS